MNARQVILRKFNGVWQVYWADETGHAESREFRDKKLCREWIELCLDRSDIPPLPWQSLDSKSQFIIEG